MTVQSCNNMAQRYLKNSSLHSATIYD